MIDAHFHCWQLSRQDYGWLTPSLAPLYRDVGIGDWLEHAQAHGVTGGVLVQAAPTEAETHFLLAQAQAHSQVKGVVGWVDLLHSGAPDRIAQLAAANPKLKGLRPMLQDLPEADWILQPALAPALQAMSEHGLVFDALVHPQHLPHIAKLVQCHPQLRVVIDHGGKPSPGLDLQWQTGLRHIAESSDPERVACKLSGLWTQWPSPSDCSTLAPWSETLLTLWGAERLMWGSDWPVLEIAGNYRHWHAWSLDFLTQRCAPAQLQQVLAGTAERMYRLSCKGVV